MTEYEYLMMKKAGWGDEYYMPSSTEALQEEFEKARKAKEQSDKVWSEALAGADSYNRRKMQSRNSKGELEAPGLWKKLRYFPGRWRHETRVEEAKQQKAKNDAAYKRLYAKTHDMRPITQVPHSEFMDKLQKLLKDNGKSVEDIKGILDTRIPKPSAAPSPTVPAAVKNAAMKKQAMLPQTLLRALAVAAKAGEDRLINVTNGALKGGAGRLLKPTAVRDILDPMANLPRLRQAKALLNKANEISHGDPYDLGRLMFDAHDFRELMAEAKAPSLKNFGKHVGNAAMDALESKMKQ